MQGGRTVQCSSKLNRPQLADGSGADPQPVPVHACGNTTKSLQAARQTAPSSRALSARCAFDRYTPTYIQVLMLLHAKRILVHQVGCRMRRVPSGAYALRHALNASSFIHIGS